MHISMQHNLLPLDQTRFRTGTAPTERLGSQTNLRIASAGSPGTPTHRHSQETKTKSRTAAFSDSTVAHSVPVQIK